MREIAVLAHLDFAEAVRAPVVAAVAERRPERVMRLPQPELAPHFLAKLHRLIARHREIACNQTRDLIVQAVWRGEVIVVPMRNDFPGCFLASQILLGSDPCTAGELDQADGWVILRN